MVARDLLGKYLVRYAGRRIVAAIITEVEAYDGPSDRGSHASRGQTPRNAPMFGPPGIWYVYFTYGMHWMLNIVTREARYPAAILIRGVTIHADECGLRRGTMRNIDGPARVTRYFKINKQFNNKQATRATGLWIEDRGIRILKSHIKCSARIGIAYAGSYWSRRKWRFRLKEEGKKKDSPC